MYLNRDLDIKLIDRMQRNLGIDSLFKVAHNSIPLFHNNNNENNKYNFYDNEITLMRRTDEGQTVKNNSPNKFFSRMIKSKFNS